MINSHYVPQFILRNFYFNDKITYCDLEKKTIEQRNSRSIFCEEGYYPEGIEKDLCKKVEYLFANLYHNKFENARNTISLSRNELFVLKKYLVVSSIRYKFDLCDEEKKIIDELGSAFKVDYDKCLNDILACENIDDAFNMLMKFDEYLKKILSGKFLGEEDVNLYLWAELKDILCSYVIIAKSRDEQFIIPDVGRGVYQGPLGIIKATSILESFIKTPNWQLAQLMHLIGPRDYSFYPLSKNIVIISMSAFYKVMTDSEFRINVIMPEDYPTVSSLLGFGDRNMITPPKVKKKGRDIEYIYDIKTLSCRDVCHFNGLMIGESNRYVAFSELDKIQKSVEMADEYTNRDISFLRYTKNNY